MASFQHGNQEVFAVKVIPPVTNKDDKLHLSLSSGKNIVIDSPNMAAQLHDNELQLGGLLNVTIHILPGSIRFVIFISFSSFFLVLLWLSG